MTRGFLPMTAEELRERGWTQPDFVFVTGDAYVDHPSFGTAIISRVLESRGYKVCIIAQPDWRDSASVRVFGRPRLGFLVSSGNMDSMVNHYTVTKRHRDTDAYTPGGETGRRPDRAATVYSNLIRQSYKDIPIILGGIEASLRRLAHYDFWSDSLKRSVLLDSQADILVYGMGERAMLDVAEALDGGLPARDITYIAGTAFKTSSLDSVYECRALPSFEELKQSRRAYADSFYVQYKNTDHINGVRLSEKYDERTYVVVNPPQPPLSEAEMDEVYALPYMRESHPSYKKPVPALDEVRFSITSSRGCFGACSFCSLTFHQGRIIQRKSREAIVREAEALTHDRLFKGYIHDVGGPTANFRHPACRKQTEHGACRDRQCLFPSPCKNIDADHSEYAALLRDVEAIPGVKKVFVRSGLRYDYMLLDKGGAFFRQLVERHISGQLKVAPEHISDHVLSLMGKPPASVYYRFVREYEKLNEKLGRKQFLVPYLMSSHPGSRLEDAITLAEYIKKTGHRPEQVQDFYPTPSTLSTCMYYTGLDPRDMSEVYVPRDPHEKAMQRALIQFYNSGNYALVHEALLKAGRRDLIGCGGDCLIPPSSSDLESKTKTRTAAGGRDAKNTNGTRDGSRRKGGTKNTQYGEKKASGGSSAQKQTGRTNAKKQYSGAVSGTKSSKKR